MPLSMPAPPHRASSGSSFRASPGCSSPLLLAVICAPPYIFMRGKGLGEQRLFLHHVQSSLEDVLYRLVGVIVKLTSPPARPVEPLFPVLFRKMDDSKADFECLFGMLPARKSLFDHPLDLRPNLCCPIDHPLGAPLSVKPMVGRHVLAQG